MSANTASTLESLSAGNPALANFPAILHIPTTAHTLAGFRRWVLAGDFPSIIRAQGNVRETASDPVLDFGERCRI